MHPRYVHYSLHRTNISSTIDWFCPNCSNALPFASCSDTSFQEMFSNPNGQLNSTTSDSNLLYKAPHLDLASIYTRNSITGLLLNARSIRSKQHQLQTFMELHPTDIVCVTETWMSADDTDFLSNLQGYSTIRHDRNSRGGGVMAIVKDSLLPIHLDNINSTDIELTWLSLTLNRSKWLVGIVYRPPNSDVTFYDKLQDACDRIQPDLHGYEGVILLGDLNINWKMESPSSTKLQDVTNSIGLTQLVEEVTRPLSNSTSTGTTIDLIFTNRPEKFTTVETIANPVSSDHHAVSFAFSANKSPLKQKLSGHSCSIIKLTSRTWRHFYIWHLGQPS